MKNCKTTEEGVALVSQLSGDGKRIMLVGEFYYGKFEGDGYTQETERATTFKCHSCLKVLKNNIRFMNHMKHHLELEKQNSESFESHTTCNHCYRQYLTPFQLQCHIESAHSSADSTTNCRICELAFESEQVLLDHMKNNHKPGEMPYVCQVCNFRSSFFSDVETHFREAHANTKDLLCPFCLKVVKSGHVYMQHYMKHQRKGIFRCGKCRLNFLSFKEKVEHRTHVHKTFKKPEALEGLPPGTKVTIRASLTGKPPPTPTYHTPTGVIVASDTPKNNKSANVQKSQFGISGLGKSGVSQKKQKRVSNNNLLLKNFRPSGKRHTCIECNGIILDFFSHFSMLLNCGACKYKTNCKKSIGNHMIRFHSAISKSRFLKENGKSSSLKLTLVCLKCDLTDSSGGNRMTKHLTKRPNHGCKVIHDKDIKAKTQVVAIEPDENLTSANSEILENPDETRSTRTAADTNGSQLQPPVKSSSTDEQENQCVKFFTEDSQEPMHKDPSNANSPEVIDTDAWVPIEPAENMITSEILEDHDENISSGDANDSQTEHSVKLSSTDEQENPCVNFFTEDSQEPMHKDPSNANSPEVIDTDAWVPIEPAENMITSEILEDHDENISSGDANDSQTQHSSRSAGWSYNEQRLINLQQQEQHRQEAAMRADKDRQLQASLRDEESFERRRYLRQVRQELKERQMESSILKAEEERINRHMQIQQEERIAKELHASAMKSKEKKKFVSILKKIAQSSRNLSQN
ncbi:hypothetical protein WMY93_013296 [Mugilogobius chulae]|uniref:C2H2-type domain-containing protein n=1 Tax=Mugilogobius chulae TaxID=88201 RepID=A0AAW0NZ27_9GOBI